VRLGDLIGQTRAATALRNAITRHRVSHAYLFSGPHGVGKSTAALAFAQALNCDRPSPDDPAAACGQCRSCRLISQGTHPDVRLISPPGKRETSVIPIDRIRRDLVYDINLRPAMGRRKVYILDPADRTAPFSIHTILKALEEPPPYAVIILVTSRPALLPPTIPSRCQQVAFQLAGIEAIVHHLQTLGLDAPVAAAIAALSGGRVAWAVGAAHHPDVLAVRNALLDLCAGLHARAASGGLRLAEEIKLQALALSQAQNDGEEQTETEDASSESGSAPAAAGGGRLRSDLPWCLDVIVSWYRDRLAAAHGAPLVNPDYAEAVSRRKSGRIAADERAIAAILETKHSLQRNANVDLALESLAIKLLAEPATMRSSSHSERGRAR